jgi:hypothetical protein
MKQSNSRIDSARQYPITIQSDFDTRANVSRVAEIKASTEDIPALRGGCFAQDRAAIVAATVVARIRGALLAWLEHDNADDHAAARAEVNTLLREGFVDVQRQVAADRKLPDA